MNPAEAFRYRVAAFFICSVMASVLGWQTRRLPKRNWAAIVAALCAFAFLVLPEALNLGNEVQKFATFIFLTAAPCAVLYSLFSFKNAPDRQIALAGIVAGGILCAIYVVALICTVVFFVQSFRPDFLS
jgi:hypothetical protein